MPLTEYRRRVLDRGNSRYKEPEVEKGWVCSRNRKKASGWNGEIKEVGRKQIKKTSQARVRSSSSTLNDKSC